MCGLVVIMIHPNTLCMIVQLHKCFYKKKTHGIFHGKTHKKPMKTMILTLKSLILIKFVKEIRLAASLIPGTTLGVSVTEVEIQ